MKPGDLISHAERLTAASPRRPHQSDLRRAVSAAYYGLFHAIAGTAANTLIGTGQAHRSTSAWTRVYRSLEHGYAKGQCLSGGQHIPAALSDVADAFVQLQELRHEADYDPNATFLRRDVEAHVQQAKTAIATLDAAGINDRRTFAAWLVFRSRA